MDLDQFQQLFTEFTDFRQNQYHPMVWFNGEPEIGKGVYIGGFSIVNAKDSRVFIGDHCDIASFVSINVADSHRRTLGLTKVIQRRSILIEHNVFIGSHSMIKGGAKIGHHSVVAAGTIVDGITIPPYSLVAGNPMHVKEDYYRAAILEANSQTSHRQ